MAADISVGIGVLGEKEFKKALDECQNSLKQLDSGLKANAAEFGKSDDALKQSAERMELLKRGYDESEKQVKALGEAVEWSKQQYGELSKETTRYVIAQNKARENAARFARELEGADMNMSELGRDAERVGRQLERGIGEAADDVSQKIESMVNTLDEDLGNIGKAVDFSAFKDKFDMAKDVIGDIGGAIFDLTEGTEDYRRTMSFLEQNAMTAGMDPQVIKDMTFEVSALTGELDGAVEGMSNLMAAGFESDELATAVDRLSAAVIQFPDTLKFESLADSLQESVATAQATGQYAEYLERMGVDLDTVNKSFEEAAKKGPEAVETVALAWLNNPSAEQALDFYKEMNQDLIDGQIAQQKWNDEVAKTADILQPYVTALTEYGTKLLALTNEAISGEKTINGKKAQIWWLPDLDNPDSKITDRLMQFLGDTKEHASDWLSGLFEGEDVNTAAENALKGGMDIAKQIGEGIAQRGEYAISQAKQLWDMIAAELSKPITGPKVSAPSAGAAGASGTGTGGTTASATLTLDGREVGRGMVDYNSDAMGAELARVETYG